MRTLVTESALGRRRGVPGHAGKARSGGVRPAPWTVGKIIECTQSKIERMEHHEPSLRRFLLVHKFMASVDPGVDADALTVDPAGQVRPLSAAPTPPDAAPLMTEASPVPRRAAGRPPARSVGPLGRRRRSGTSSGRPQLVAPVKRLSSHPIKKRRLKRLLGDAGCFAAAGGAQAGK